MGQASHERPNTALNASERLPDVLRALEKAGVQERPAAVLDRAALDENMRLLGGRLRQGSALRESPSPQPTLRVASKSIRSRRALEHVLARQPFAGVLAFTAAEALWLAQNGVEDIVLGYPTADSAGVRAILADPRAAVQVSFMADSAEHLQMLSEAAAATGASARICIELDAGFKPLAARWAQSLKLESALAAIRASSPKIGAMRSPLFAPEHVEAFAQRALSTPGIEVAGLMGYESQIAGVYDGGNSPRARAIRLIQMASRAEIAERRAETVARVRALTPLEFVNGGGTGSIESTASEDAVTEVAAGSGLFGPGLFDRYRDFQPANAVHFGLSVVRRPDERTATVLGGGWVASGVPGADRLPEPVWPQGLEYAPEEAAGEVQTPLRGSAASELKLGDTVLFRHAKSGEICERVNELVVVDGFGGETHVIDHWATYRGEGKAFL